MRTLKPLSALAFSNLAMLVHKTPGMTHGKGLYTTAANARQRASEIGCSSIHENNGRWMPCANERELHQQLRKQ